MRAAIVMLAAAPAAAQVATVEHTPDFSVERLTPAPGPATFLQVEDGNLLPAGATAWGLMSSASRLPLVVRDAKGMTLSEPVAFRLGTDLLGAAGASDRLQLGLALPLVAYQSGDRLRRLGLPDADAEDALPAGGLGDLRLHAKLRVVAARNGYGFGAAAAAVVSLPTGGRQGFSGERGPTFEGRAILFYRVAGAALGLNLGARVRTAPVAFLSPAVTLGHELPWGLAADVSLGRRADAFGELAGAVGLGKSPSPAEARVGVRARVAEPWTIGVFAGVGVGTTDAVGAPAWRGGVEVRFEPTPVADSDGDGIPDVRDRCPSEPEDRDGWQDADGCPDPDNDGDGIPDARDKCPNEAEDKDNFQDEDGCPDPDNDGDGIPDARDKCPLEPEDFDGFSDEDGCPDADNDNDGIPDDVDKCPNEPEDRDGWEDADGCPDPDNDGDGVPDAVDRCPTQAEDKDGWQDQDGCPDLDDDRDGVPDAVDKCPDQAGTEPDGCPHGPPLALARPDGTIALRFAVEFVPGKTDLAPNGERILRAIAAAAHHAGWDEAAGDALVVTLPGDGPAWSELAGQRSLAVCRRLSILGIRCRVEAVARVEEGTFRATPEAISAGRRVIVKGSLLSP
ncbi:MAG TPA: thrombospondin type 3 repeat-containing protein [Haliangiales bacterium]|nr:thrombospondin type 3 repeat-containing protein [Haliangiales bacterium]